MSTFTIYHPYTRYLHQSIRSIRKTPKQFRTEDRNGNITIYKPTDPFNKLFDVVLPNGSVRQIICLASYIHKGCAENDLRRNFAQGKWEFRGSPIYAVAHKDDKVYEEFRWGIVRSVPRWVGATTNHNVVSFDLSSHKQDDKVYLFKQKFVRWGDRDILLNDGVRRYEQGDPLTDYSLIANESQPKSAWEFKDISSKNVSEFPTNPFAEGNHSVDRNPYILSSGEMVFVKPDAKAADAVKSFLWKREIAEAVFHPARVEKMLNCYGQQWIDEIA